MDHEPAQYTHRRANYPEVGTPEVRRQIGKELKSAREFQEMSLEQVTAITKINVRFLENIEEGRWSFLPPTYVKVFIRAYAAAVGIQKDKLASRLDDLFKNVVAASAPVKQELYPSDEGPVAQPAGRLLIWAEQNRALLFYGAIGLMAAILITLYMLRTENPFRFSLDREDSLEVAKPPEEPIKSEPAPTAPAVVPTDTTARDTTLSFLSLQLAAKDTCYLKIESGDSVAYDKTLWPGSKVDFTLREPVRLSLGNAPAVELTVDGKTLPAFPSSRRVQVITLGKGGSIN